MKQGYFGTLQDGRSAQWLEIENEKLRVRVSDYGATLVSLWLKDAQIDAVLGFDEVSGYQQSVKYMGAMIGRVANRIKDGQFTLNGQVYSLYRNDKGNTLHGGQEGFDAKLWTVIEQREDSLTLRLCSPAGEEGFPAEVTVTVTYALAGPRLSITTRAESTAATPVSLTNHAYFTLSGPMPSLAEHWIQVDADEIGLLDPNGCTRPETMEVEGTVFDLREPKRIADVLKQHHSQLEIAGGLDHNYVLNGIGFRPVASLHKGALTMRVLTDMPDMHVYTANFLNSDCGRGGAQYTPHCAVCFETQYYPNSVNDPSKISCILHPGETMEHCTAFEFDQEEQA
ncbi:aldose epimerase family protein [Holdemania massiliensis]|uniref:aldose epimerase family protein n=1 Tax=Holdemania massiliensis TaxID=1468449 RepID=UPI003521BBD8